MCLTPLWSSECVYLPIPTYPGNYLKGAQYSEPTMSDGLLKLTTFAVLLNGLIYAILKLNPLSGSRGTDREISFKPSGWFRRLKAVDVGLGPR